MPATPGWRPSSSWLLRGGLTGVNDQRQVAGVLIIEGFRAAGRLLRPKRPCPACSVDRPLLQLGIAWRLLLPGLRLGGHGPPEIEHSRKDGPRNVLDGR